MLFDNVDGMVFAVHLCQRSDGLSFRHFTGNPECRCYGKWYRGVGKIAT